MQKASIIIKDPTYSGLRTTAYGPVVVSSRDLFNVPADQLRIAKPHPSSPKALTTQGLPISHGLKGVVCLMNTLNETSVVNPTRLIATRRRASQLRTQVGTKLGRAQVVFCN